MKTRLIALLLTLFSTTVMACEPAAFNFDLFLQVNDSNRDGFLSEQELLNADMQQNYGNTLTKPVNTKEAFKTLDTNRDGKLSVDELWQWGNYNDNACERLSY